MASIGAITTASSILDTLLTALGINGWQLKDGVYNGCTFAAFTQVPIVQNNPIVQNGGDLFAAVNEIIGNTFGDDANGFGRLFNTFLGTLRFTDKLNLQIVTKELPFANRCNTEDMGTGGYTFSMTLLFLGTEYQKALRNFENAILYPPNDPTLSKVLIHPTRGLIPGITRVTSFDIDSSLANWNAATVQVTFRSEQTSGGTISNSTIQNFTNALQAALATVAGIAATAALFKDAVNSNGRIPTGQTSNATFTQSTNIQTQSNDLSQTLYDNVNYIYQSSNTGASNATLNSTPINYANLPPALNQVTNYVSSQSDIILAAYQEQSNAVLGEIAASRFGDACNGLVNQISSGITALQNVATLAIPVNSTLSYTVPSDMSIRGVMANNGINFNNALKILINNPQIACPNLIPQGTVVQL